jgi:hypothetical protein
MTTRQQAIEDLSVFGTKEPQTYLLDIIPLVEMMLGGRRSTGKSDRDTKMNICISVYSKSMRWQAMQQ